MKELKMGQLVEIKNTTMHNRGFSSTRIFIKTGKDKSAICVREGDHDAYLRGESFDTYTWDWGYWRVIKEREYVPYDHSHLSHLIGRVIKSKDKDDDGYMSSITGGNHRGILLSDEFSDYEELLHDYVFEDGSPCGELVE